MRYAGAGAAEMAWEEATERERVRWGWRCRNSMGGGEVGGYAEVR